MEMNTKSGRTMKILIIRHVINRTSFPFFFGGGIEGAVVEVEVESIAKVEE